MKGHSSTSSPTPRWTVWQSTFRSHPGSARSDSGHRAAPPLMWRRMRWLSLAAEPHIGSAPRPSGSTRSGTRLHRLGPRRDGGSQAIHEGRPVRDDVVEQGDDVVRGMYGYKKYD